MGFVTAFRKEYKFIFYNEAKMSPSIGGEYLSHTTGGGSKSSTSLKWLVANFVCCSPMQPRCVENIACYART